MFADCMVLSRFCLGSPFCKVLQQKRGSGIQIQLPDHGHVHYTRTLPIKHFSSTYFEPAAVRHCKNKGKWDKTGALMEDGEEEEEGKETIWCHWKVSSCSCSILLLFVFRKCGWVIARVLTSLRTQLEDTCFINQPHKFHTRQSTITSVVASSSFCSSETLSLSPFLHSVSKKA